METILCLTKHHAMKKYGGTEVSGLVSRPGRFMDGVRAPAPNEWKGLWAGTRAGLDTDAGRIIHASAENRTPVVEPVT
jgi:hypothetical protein